MDSKQGDKHVFLVNFKSVRKKGLRKCSILLKIKSDLQLKYLFLDLEGSATLISAYSEQNNTLFTVCVYHSETGEITHTNKGYLLLLQESLS